ncbi:MAG: NAD-dependent epimerase/dehydratase family protein [Capsulimonadaceae bacterium]|nr:NAD-dependent epimerase/dehydratase family protein [Capsulimonadaceae bacterium]
MAMNQFYHEIAESANQVGGVWQELSGARIFATGCTGFLGRWILAALLHANRTHDLGLSIVCLSRDPDRFASLCPGLAADPALKLLAGDVRACEFPDGPFTHVIHAAADTSAAADARPLELADTILVGARRVLDFAVRSGARRLLLTSSGAVYGAQPADLAAMPETYEGACSTTDVRSNYAQSKRMAEQFCTIYHQQYGIETVIARCFAFVGPFLDPFGHFAIGNFVRDAVRGGEIVVSGDGTPVRSFLYASDAAVWLAVLLARGRGGTAYNVGSSEAISIGDLAKLVADTIPGAQGVRILGAPQPGGFRSRYIPDTTRARTELGLEPWIGLEESIRRYAGWVRTVA